jgi:hypothetical protein
MVAFVSPVLLAQPRLLNPIGLVPLAGALVARRACVSCSGTSRGSHETHGNTWALDRAEVPRWIGRSRQA